MENLMSKADLLNFQFHINLCLTLAQALSTNQLFLTFNRYAHCIAYAHCNVLVSCYGFDYQGLAYRTRSQQLVPAQTFIPVDNCCKRQCFQKIDERDQRGLFENFYQISSYDKQNLHLSGLMSSVSTRRISTAPATHNRQAMWHYVLKVRGKETVVCRTFFQAVFHIGVKRTFFLPKKFTRI